VPKYSQSLDRTFHALGDGTRRAMIERLVRGPASVSELAAPFDMALPSVVQHLGVLEAAAIVTSTKVGRVRTYQLAVDALSPAAAWIGDQQLPAERRLDRLGAYLTRPAGSKATDTSTTDKETEDHVRDHRTQSNPRDVRRRT
jgi:DNA-binding transcriptional ArsR family regulator